jgi:hypothetical protein
MMHKNKVLCGVGILALLMAMEGIYRIYTLVRILGGGDTVIYMGMLLAMIYAIVVFILSLTGKCRRLWKIIAIVALVAAGLLLLAAPSVGAVWQGLIGIVVGITGLFFAAHIGKHNT